MIVPNEHGGDAEQDIRYRHIRSTRYIIDPVMVEVVYLAVQMRSSWADQAYHAALY